MRQQNYERTLQRIHAHNSRRWTAGVNHLADRSEEEFRRLFGWAGHKGARKATPPLTMEFAVSRARNTSHEDLPKEFNWTDLKAVQHIRDQGDCGSCWAVATATVLTAHAELAGIDSVFSPQQLVSCTPNPKHCGGTGGCDGATAELAMEYALQKGLSTEDDFPYSADDTECPDDLQVKDDELSLSVVSPAALSVGFTGWTKLEENELLPMMTALVQEGPLAIAVAATDDWMWYAGGIMDTCEKDAVLNHAVALIGYGQDDSEDDVTKYWLLQNSWTKEWGEDGLVRLQRFDDDDEQDYCGWDKKPEDGSGCDGGPEQVRVCGSCGILYDTVVPHFRKPSSLASHKSSSHTSSSHTSSSHKSSSRKTSSHKSK